MEPSVPKLRRGEPGGLRIDTGSPDGLKVDVEGSEWDLLEDLIPGHCGWATA